MSKLTDKNTKKEFMDKYNEQVEIIKNLQAQLADPKQIVNQQRAATVMATANSLVNSDIASVTSTLHEELSKAISDLVSKVSKGSEELISLDETIKIKKDQLKELFDIEATAYSITALLNTEKTLIAEHEKAKKERTTELEAQVKGLQDQIDSLTDLLNEKLNELVQEVEEERVKKETEWKYDFDRKKKKEQDDWNDKLAQEEKKLKEKQYELETRELEVAKREDNIEEYEAKIAAIPSLVDKAESAGFAKATNAAKSERNNEIATLTAKHNSEVAILENKVQMLEERIASYVTENSELKSDLKSAYAQVQSTAQSAVEAQANANARLISGVEGISKESLKSMK